jgi:hypothetical protein
MESLSFWTNWTKSNKIQLLVALIQLVLAVGVFGFYYYHDLLNVIDWKVLSEQGEVSALLEQFKATGEVLSIPIKSYLVTGQFLATIMSPNITASWIFVLGFAWAFSLFLASITVLPRFWYLLAMAFVVEILVLFHWDLLLNISGSYLSLFIIFLLGGLSYFYHAFKPDITFSIRFISFLILTFSIGFGVSHYSPMSTPVMHFAAYLVGIGLLLTCCFIFYISFEVLRGFLFITTTAQSPKSLLNFSVISLFYSLNLLVLYWYKNGTTDWDILYINPFFLLICSTFLGIWGIVQRGKSLGASIRLENGGVFSYISLATISILTCAYAFATANDPLVEVLEDAIIYTHLVMGVLFLLYAIFNFLPLFKQGLNVYQVVFKPMSLPLSAIRIAGILAVVALLSLKEFFTINQAKAAYYNALGDFYTNAKDYQYAEIQYKIAATFEGRNHKTNYALASLAILQHDNETAALYFKKALAKNPSPFAYEGLARSFYDGERFFDALFTLKEGVKRFPKSGELQNNLAYLYDKSHVLDSALIFYDLAAKNANDGAVPEANVLAFWAKNGKEKTIKELIQEEKQFKDDAYQANLLALKLKAGLLPAIPTYETTLGDSILNVPNFSFLYNQAMFEKSKGEKIAFRALANRAENDQYAEDLEFAHAIQQYYKGDKQLTFEQLQAWATGDTTAKKNKYYGMLLNTLIKKESLSYLAIDKLSTEDALTKAVEQAPLDAGLLAKICTVFNQQKHPEKAYQYVANALKWRKDNPALYHLYILQALEIGMKEYAADALLLLQKLSLTDYQRFLPQYQAKLALIEKQQQGFH